MRRLLLLALVLAVAAAGCDLFSDVIRDGALTAPGLLVGERVALDGDAALLGAPASNDAFVFERSAGGWTASARLSPSQARVPDPRFGQHLDLDGDLAVLGAPENDVALDAAGHAYVYARVGGTWVEQAVLRPDDLAPNANFGNGVAVSGNVVAVSAGDDEVAENRTGGRVHVFERTGGVWSRTAVLSHPAPGLGTGFGGQVSLDGHRLAVDGSAGVRMGRVFVFERDASGAWKLDSTIEEPVQPGETGALSFGIDLALDGPTLVVRGYRQGYGLLHVYRKSGPDWALEATLGHLDEELETFGLFGARVAVSGDRLVAAVPGRRLGGDLRGSAIVYARTPDGSWTEEAELQLSGPVSGFGRDVDIDGDTVLVGVNSGGQGGAYLFRRGADGWQQAR